MRLYFASAKAVYKDCPWFYSFWTYCKTRKECPSTCCHCVKVCFYFSLLFKKKKITDAVTHLLVLLLALMENVKGAQPH